jgi:L-fuconolactonase
MASPATNADWLALTVEAPLEPDLPICDPHHHLWDFRPTRVAPRYLLDEILADVRSGHNVVSTVFIECASMFKADGPEAMRPMGEIEFVNGIAAMSASGQYGPVRIAAGIVGTADLRLGDAVAAVLDAHLVAGGGRFRGIRLGGTWDASDAVPNHRTNPPKGLFLRQDFRAGFAQLALRQLTLGIRLRRDTASPQLLTARA